jgi:dihydroorotate dehydrogenase subfamily 1
LQRVGKLQESYGIEFELGEYVMADLKVNICGIQLKNPVMPAAGPPVRDGKCVVECAKGGAGILVTKTISIKAAEVPRPCMEEIPGGFLNTELWSELPPEEWIEREYSICREANLPLIVSLGYTAEEIESLVPKVTPFADALEISTHYVGKDIQPIVNSLKAALKSGKPVFMKISPGIPDVGGYAKRLQEEGASGFVAINSVGPSLHINIETGLPFMGSTAGYGWLSGKAIKPIAMRHVYEIANSVSIPVIGVGGIETGEDAIEMMMAGASAVQICTAAILEGPSIYGRVARQMNTWLDEHNYKSSTEIIGLTSKIMCKREFRTSKVCPEVQKDLCIACGRCMKSCAYQAIEIEDTAVIDKNKCFGCGLCVTRCAKKAIKL